jgi:6-phosphogluconate dehydrogenase
MWWMLPAGEITERTVSDLAGMLDAGNAIVDGKKTHYGADLRRAEALAANGMHYVDVSVSGGVFGLERGRRPDSQNRGLGTH